MFTTEQILQLAQDLQPRILKLQPADRAAEIDRQLTQLMAQYHSGEDVTEDIFDLIYDQPEFASEVASQSEEISKDTRHLARLDGNSDVHLPKHEYQCPECQKTYPSLPQNRPPECDDHPNTQLILITQS